MPRRRGRGIAKPAKSPQAPQQKYYAVRFGKDGFAGVLHTWPQCQQFVSGVKGAVYRSFPDLEQANAFAYSNSAKGSAGSADDTTPHPSASSKVSFSQKFYSIKVGRDGYRGVVTSWEECKLYVHGVNGAEYKSFKDYDQAVAFAGIVEEKNNDESLDASPVRMAPPPLASSSVLPETELVVYTDGACVNNGKHNAKAGYGVYFGPDSPFNISERLRGPSTNQRAEMMAVLAAMRTVLENDLVGPGGNFIIKTDSKYTKNGMDTWIDDWKKKKNKWMTAAGTEVKNKGLWMALDKAKEDLKARDVLLTIEWVKGHMGITGNEMADRLAVDGIYKPI